MTLLILTQYFWPESFVINDLARTLRDLGHTVVVATAKPNYPEGAVFAGYTAAGVQREVFDGNIEVIRVPLRPRGSGGAVNLFRNYLSFVWSGAIRFPWLLRGRRFDAIVVFAVSPITSAIPAIPVKWLCRSHLAIWIQDLWPDSLVTTGFVRSKALLSAIGVVVRGIYAFADTLLIQSHALVEPVARHARRDAIVYYSNSIPDFAPGTAAAPPDELLRVLKAGFCALFAGNLGTAQSVDTLVGAAQRLRGSGINVVLIGTGSRSDWVRQQKEALGLDNLILFGRQPADVMPEIYRHAGCLLVTLKDDETLRVIVPSKLQSYFAAGRPIVAAINGEGARVVADAQAGLTCAAEDADGLAAGIRSLRDMPEADRGRLGAAGRAYFLEHFEMRGQAQHLVEILERRIAERGRRT